MSQIESREERVRALSCPRCGAEPGMACIKFHYSRKRIPVRARVDCQERYTKERFLAECLANRTEASP